MLAMAGALELQATSVDRSVLDTLDYVREITALTRDHIPGRVPARDDDGRLLTDAGGKPVMRELMYRSPPRTGGGRSATGSGRGCSCAAI